MTGAAIRAVIVCPGRGSYGRAQIGSLPDGDPIVAALDRFRSALGRPGVSELDRAAFTPRLHVAGEHASILTFACTAVDVAAIDRRAIDVVGVTGNSMGFYTALHVAGALDLDAAATLVETLGSYQANHVIGGQLVYPTVDDRWRPDPALAAAATAALAEPGVYLSIRLGGAIVLGADAGGLDRARRVLPPLERGGLTYPLYLLHMQLGYVLFTRQAPTNAVPWVVAIVLAMTWLAWIVWRYVERPAQRWVRDFLSGRAVRLGWPLKLRATVSSSGGSV